MLTVFWQYLKERKVSLFIYSGAGLLLLWLYTSIYPTISQSTQDLEKLIQAFPEPMREAFGISENSYSTFNGFIASENYSMIWPILAIILIISCSAAALSGEVEKGTIELLVSQPISRLKLFIGRYLSVLAIFILFDLITVLGVIPLATMYDITFSATSFWTMAIAGGLFGLATISLSFLFSALFSEKGKVYSIMGGGMLAMYVLNIMAMLKDSLDIIKYASFFYYFNPGEAIKHSTIDSSAYWVFLGVSLIATLLAIRVFTKRDIAA